MDSKSSKPEIPADALSLDGFGRDVELRRQRLGKIDMPRNAGTRRTASKRALLEAIAATEAKW